MPEIFISYRRDDSAFESTVLYETLQKSFGKRSVFMDVDGIPVGVDFGSHIVKTLERSDICLAVMSESWLSATSNGLRRLDDPQDFVRQELEISNASGLHIVPVLIGKTELPPAESLPDSLQFLPSLQAIRIRPGGDLQKDLRSLCDRLRQIGVLRDAAHRPQGNTLARLGSQLRRCWWHPFLDAFVTMAISCVVAFEQIWQPALQQVAGEPLFVQVFAYAFGLLMMYVFVATLFGLAVVYGAIHDAMYCGAMALVQRFVSWRFLKVALLIGFSTIAGGIIVSRSGIGGLLAVYGLLWIGLLVAQYVVERMRSHFNDGEHPLRGDLKAKALSSANASLWLVGWFVAASLVYGTSGLVENLATMLAFGALAGSVYYTAAQIVRGTLAWRESP